MPNSTLKGTSIEQRPIRSKRALTDAIQRSYGVRRDIATGPTKIQSAFLSALNDLMVR